MNITDYKNEEIPLRCIAAHVAHEFTKLKRIGDVKWIPIWNYYVPHETIVGDFWKYLASALVDIGDTYGICRADIQFESHRSAELRYIVDRGEEDSIITTGIRIERITDAAKMKIENENKLRCK